MKNFLTNFNWPNWLLLIFFTVMMCIDLDKDDYISACANGFVAIFNMFLIVSCLSAQNHGRAERTRGENNRNVKRERRIIL